MWTFVWHTCEYGHVCIDMRIVMCIDMCKYMCKDMCIGMCVHTCMVMFV